MERYRGDDGHYVFEGAVTDEDVLELAAYILERRIRRDDVIFRPEHAKQYLVVQLGGLENEVFGCMFLDSQHRIITFEKMFNGTIDGASVHPREVVKRALGLNAAAVILAHNHPSGVPVPSEADKALTLKLQSALRLVDIRVLDHILVAGPETTSFAERGLL